MAKEHRSLSELPPRASQRFEEKYPDVKKWLNGSVWELQPKVDFKVGTETFYQSFRSYLDRTQTKAELGQRGKSIWVKAGSQSQKRSPRRPSKAKKGSRR